MTCNEKDDNQGKASPALRDVFDRFVAEHAKYAYFLLAAAAAAIAYALDKILEGQRHQLDCIAGLAVALWMTSFWVGCERIKKMLVGLHSPVADKKGIHYHEIAGNSGSTAKYQYWWFIAGVIAYGLWVLATYILTAGSTTLTC